MQGKGTWRMLCQGMNVPLLKVDTIVECVGGQVANDKESDAVELDGDGSDCELLADLEGEEKEDSCLVLNVQVVGPPLCRKRRRLERTVARNQGIRRFLPRPMLCTAATTFVIGRALWRRDAAMPIASFVGMKPFSRHPRVMGRGRRGEAVSPMPPLWSRLHTHIVRPKNKILFTLRNTS
jgi:hypothetical protein